MSFIIMVVFLLLETRARLLDFHERSKEINLANENTCTPEKLPPLRSNNIMFCIEKCKIS